MMSVAIAFVISQAAPDPRIQRCLDTAGGVSATMLDCGRQDIARWDGRLNAAYQGLLKALTPSGEARLRAEQRAWLARHIKETRRLAADPNEGSAAFLLSQSFELQDLSTRTVELEKRLAQR